MDEQIATWAGFWKFIMIFGCATFAILTVYVVIWGAKDVAQLFRDLAAGGGGDSENKPTD